MCVLYFSYILNKQKTPGLKYTCRHIFLNFMTDKYLYENIMFDKYLYDVFIIDHWIISISVEQKTEKCWIETQKC